MTQRRAIACTICAKAKTKCDKAVPTCSRCAAKGLPCEPRSTRRTSDSSYRQAKKHVVSPKRFPSSTSIPTMRRDGSPRSVPSSDRPHLARSLSQMDMSTAQKMGHRRPELTGMPMLTPLPTFNPQIIDECYSDYGSPEPSMGVFPHQMEKNGYNASGRLTPQTPDSFTYSEPLSVVDPFDQYLNSQVWSSDEVQMPIGLGFENEIPGMMQNEADMRTMWSTPDLDGNSTPVQHMRTFESPVCESPASFNVWPHHSVSVSPPQPPHTKAVPSLSVSECSVQDFDSTAAFQDEWPSFRCNPVEMNLAKPSTSTAYLEGLRAIPKNSNVWEENILTRMSPNLEASPKYLSLDRIEDALRDTIMDVANSFIRKARQLSKSARLSPPVLPINDSVDGVDDSLPSSPSAAALETLFRSYGSRFEPYYQNFAARKLDPTDLLPSDTSKLLLLLILAAGASATPTKEASSLTHGLIESSRILLGDLTDNDMTLWRDPMVLRSALLYINLAAWSGEKWHIDVAKTQSELYLTMLRRSALFAYREKSLPEFDGLVGTEISWRKWLQHESLNRLIYSWVIADQELGLFYDKAPTFSTLELTAALPDRETLWQATSADSWSLANPNKTGTPPSLNGLFKRLTSRELVNDARGLTRLQLRLLLHPLQAQVHNLHQSIGYFVRGPTNALPQHLLVQMRKVQEYLGDWFVLCYRRTQGEDHICPVLLSNFVMYHLICLNTMTNFPEIESFARGEVTPEQFVATSWARTAALGSAQRIWFHCGQLIRLVRLMPEPNRPLWFPAVIYRVCLLLWSTSIASPIKSVQPVAQFSESVFAIDSLSPEHETLVRYLRFQQGTPMLRLKKGVWYSLFSPKHTLLYCLEVMEEEELNTNFAMGIRNRLELLARRVKMISPVF
ncbi:hypothetical protein K469DRAFT_730124 [Zopfia rhizophila CBS 207.26]|uniref:Zn(2)-C6 fungal-type domain-containing protein n=1 Tax=Zopfia rhizophila CBS 207.26 TaxID=1314779 RepID=A0A6A6EPK0_9PEZI|nr:hypothetical protein K469DRAFT_730124 [Zopfia rhizophila CBS 207.26]